MGTISNLLEIALRCVGKKEDPPGSNNVCFNTWYYGHEVRGSAYPWCMVFCQWVYSHANVELPIRTASCGTLMRAAKEIGKFVRNNLRPGDLVLLSFNGSPTPQHCGIVSSVERDYVCTIEGNTGDTSQDNGGCVMRKRRSYSNVVGAFRPTFEEEIDMTIDEFISKLTPRQAYDIMLKSEAYAESKGIPSYAEKDGYWKALMDAKIIKNNTPEAHLKRVEFATILGRMGLIKIVK